MVGSPAAQAWVEEQLAAVREATRTHPPDRPVEEYEALLRGWAAVIDQPTEPYLGLALTEADLLASRQGRVVQVRTGSTRRGNFVWHRVNVWLDGDGRVVRAETDGRPWERPAYVAPDPEPVPPRVDARTSDAIAPVLAALHGYEDRTATAAEARAAVDAARQRTGIDPGVSALLDRLAQDLAGVSSPTPSLQVRATFLELRSAVNDA